MLDALEIGPSFRRRVHREPHALAGDDMAAEERQEARELAVARRVGAALVAGGVMLVLVVMSLIAGSDLYLWVAPLPTDIPSLFFHGARTPLVVSAMVLLVTVGIARLVADRNHHVSRIPSETREREAEGTLH